MTRYFVKNDQNGTQKIVYNGPGSGPADFTEVTLEAFQNANIKKTETYSDLRRTAYPPIVDQLDAIWKGGAEAEEMRQRILDIKRQFPKE